MGCNNWKVNEHNKTSHSQPSSRLSLIIQKALNTESAVFPGLSSLLPFANIHILKAQVKTFSAYHDLCSGN